MELIVIDFEVFKHNWLMCWLNLTTKSEGYIADNADELKAFYEAHADDLYITYNGKGYDQYIFKGILNGDNPYDINEFIITQGNDGWKYSQAMNQIPLNLYDVYLGAIDRGLKELESFMGVSIHESSVDFRLDRELTKEEIEETISYCRDDVRNTAEVFKRRMEIFNSYVNLIKHFKLGMSGFKRTRAQLSASCLRAQKIDPPYRDEFRYILPDCLKLGKYEYVKEWYLNPDNFDYKKELIVKTKTCDLKFAFGGLHDSLGAMDINGKIIACDVASYYPNLMRQYLLMSRAVPYPEVFYNMITERVKLKKTNPQLASSYKIVLNSAYGQMGDVHSSMYDKRMANSVCLSGQLLLLDLIEKVENYGRLINVNTDGIYVLCDTDEQIEKVKELAHEWEQRSGMGMEFDEYTRYISKDVNSYILIDSNGHVKTKGMVKELGELDYNLAIVNKALRAYLIDGVKPEEFIAENNEFMDYMMTVKLKGDFKQIVHIENGATVKISNKVVRVFASTGKGDGMIGRTREKKSNQCTLFCTDDGEWNPESAINGVNKFADTPDHCFVENGDIRGLKCPDKLDKQWYVDLVYDKLKFWKVD